jgi:hypothetical protein
MRTHCHRDIYRGGQTFGAIEVVGANGDGITGWRLRNSLRRGERGMAE